MDRRNFIKLTAATGGAATLAGCGNPEHQLIRFIPEEDLAPGIAEIKPGVCPLWWCAGRKECWDARGMGAGAVHRLREHRPWR